MRELLERLKKSNERALELARYASVAARVEPELLRALRIDCVQRADVSAEADLWWSGLVDVRSPLAIRFSPEALVALRAELGVDGAELAYSTVKRVHSGAAPMVCLEELLIYLALTGDLVGVERELAKVAGTLLDEPTRRDEVGSWAIVALPRLPDVVQCDRVPSFWNALFLANAQGRGVGSVGDAAGGFEHTRKLPPDVFRRAGYVELDAVRQGGVLKLRQGRNVEEHAPGLVVPRIEPVLVEVDSRPWSVPRNRPAEIPVTGPVVTVTAVDGRTYQLHPRLKVAPEEEAFDPRPLATVQLEHSAPVTGYLVTEELVATVSLASEQESSSIGRGGVVTFLNAPERAPRDAEVVSVVHPGLMLLRIATIPGVTAVTLDVRAPATSEERVRALCPDGRAVAARLVRAPYPNAFFEGNLSGLLDGAPITAGGRVLGHASFIAEGASIVMPADNVQQAVAAVDGYMKALSCADECNRLLGGETAMIDVGALREKTGAALSIGLSGVHVRHLWESGQAGRRWVALFCIGNQRLHDAANIVREAVSRPRNRLELAEAGQAARALGLPESRAPEDSRAAEGPSLPTTALGATPHEHGTTFRLWAPNADEVLVTTGIGKVLPMKREADGVWSADGPGVHPGATYVYSIHGSHGIVKRGDPRGREVAPNTDSLVISTAGSQGLPFRTPALTDLVIYQLHTATFGSENGSPGTFESVAGRLDYLWDLGVNAIQLLPVTECPGAFSLGFGPSHPFSVKGDYGGVDALKRLVEMAHARGIAVLLEVVYTHMSPTNNVLWNFDGDAPNGNGGIYYDGGGDTPWGRSLAYHRPEVRQFVHDNVIMWFEEFAVDGLHWPAAGYVGGGPDAPRSMPGWLLMQSINREVKARFPEKIMTAETSQMVRELTMEAGFDAVWDPRFVRTVRSCVQGAGATLSSLREAIWGPGFNLPSWQRVIYSESLDDITDLRGARLADTLGGADRWDARRRAILASAIALTSPGIPLLSQGQEFLTSGSLEQPMDWNVRFPDFAATFRELIRLRWELVGLRSPHINVFHLNENHHDSVIAFHRWDKGGPGDDVVVVVNFGARRFPSYRIGFPRPGRWRVRFASADHLGRSMESRAMTELHAYPGDRDGLPAEGELNLASQEVMILHQGRDEPLA